MTKGKSVAPFYYACYEVSMKLSGVNHFIFSEMIKKSESDQNYKAVMMDWLKNGGTVKLRDELIDCLTLDFDEITIFNAFCAIDSARGKF